MNDYRVDIVRYLHIRLYIMPVWQSATKYYEKMTNI